ncbi:MAG: ribosomal-protein-alanine N-acetyltransferase, partial [Bacteroidia bacterium]
MTGEVLFWANNQKDVKTITAETDLNNFASHRLLEKCNFTRFKQDTDTIWW